MNIIIALLIIGVLIFVHELGHFWAARRAGIEVHEFSLGFGPAVIHRVHKGVKYSLRLIPLGGFVKVAGVLPEDRDNPAGFMVQKPLNKIKFIFAGPFMNFVLAIVLFIAMFALIGIPHPVEEAVIGDTLPGRPAAEAGLLEGDVILQLNRQEVSSWQEFVSLLGQSEAGVPLDLTVQRDEEIFIITVTPEMIEGVSTPVIGVYPMFEYERQGIFASIKYGFIQTYQMTAMLLGGLWMLFTGAISTSELAGPVGITRMVGDAAQGGIMYLMSFTAFLSINLGILNLLPIPALDGSRIMFVLVEIIRKKPLEPEKEGLIHFVGFVFLMLLIILITYNDIVRLIRG